MSSSPTERLLVSSSPSPSEANRLHSLYTSGGNNTQSAADRYSTLSPTSEGNHRTYTPVLSRNSDKYIQQVSKSIQSYGNDRYQLSTNQNEQFDRNSSQDRYPGDRFPNGDRFQSSGNDRYLTTLDRYSPARTNTDKYLSLPKSKDKYTSGRVTSSCSSISSNSSERPYGSGNGGYIPPTAHTPVER